MWEYYKEYKRKKAREKKLTNLLLMKFSEPESTDYSNGVAIGDFAPDKPIAGDLWLNGINNRLYIYHVDAQCGQWVPIVKK